MDVKEKTIVLIDGVCHFCHASARFILRRDRKHIFYFASLQSSIGQQLLEKYATSKDIVGDLGSVVLIDEGKVYTESDAVLRICRKLSGLWPLCYGGIIIPRFIRNGLYRQFAKKRYDWFGQADSCIIPKPEDRARFLDL